jgi:hypothetical protein
LKLQLPFWLYPLAFLLGLLIGAAALRYTPDGRINLMLVWLVWAGLPFVGACLSGVMMFRKQRAPWILKFSGVQRWQLDSQSQLRLWLKLHQLWCLSALGILVAFLTLLLFTDLAFGWSSTLVNDPALIHKMTQVLSVHWQAYWPSAVPDQTLIEHTRFIRIAPTTEHAVNAGDWWPFLLASLITYNLLPRVLLILVCLLQLRHPPQSLSISSNQPVSASTETVLADLLVQDPADWAGVEQLFWEISAAEGLTLGVDSWESDQQRWQALLKRKPSRLVWCIDLRRSPLAEMADKVKQASAQGIQQAIRVWDNSLETPAHARDSWQLFARQHQLVWLEAR